MPWVKGLERDGGTALGAETVTLDPQEARGPNFNAFVMKFF